MAWEHAFSQHILDLALSEEDVEELRSERSIKHTSITAEEIEELSIDETLNPYERVIHVLNLGKEIQKVYILEHMYDVIKDESKEKIEKVLLLFKDVMQTEVLDFHIAGSKFLQQVCENQLINGEKFASLFFKDLFNNIQNKNNDIRDGWVSAFIASLTKLPKRFLNETVVFLKNSGSLTQSLHTRLLCCKLIAHVSKFIDRQRLKSDLIPVMRFLCQDIDLDVRASMCSELYVLLCSLEESSIKDFLLPELSLLLQDEETSVRTVALETLSKLIPSLDSKLISTPKLKTIVITYYQKAVEKSFISEIVASAHFIGQIISCAGFLDEGDKVELVECFISLCGKGTGEREDKNDDILIEGFNSAGLDGKVQCRHWCSYNFPAVLVSLKPENIPKLMPSFQALVKDKFPAVRRPIAFGFYEIARLLVTDDADFILDILVALLHDKEAEVLDGILTCFPLTLKLLSSYSLSSNISSLVPTLLDCEQFLSQSLKWRTHQKLIETMSCFTEFLTPEETSSKLTPVLLCILTSRKALPVRIAAGQTLLNIAKQSKDIDERNEICMTMEANLAHSQNKTCRILYLDLCHHVAHLFSRSFFKEKFYGAAMGLAGDPVVNVKLKFCETLPLLKTQIRLPCDRLLLQTLEQTVRRIMAMENDRDVSNAIRTAITNMDMVRVSMDGTPMTDEDRIDQKKELEEDKIAEEYTQKKCDSGGKLQHRDLINSNLHISPKDSVSGPSSRRSVILNDSGESHDKLHKRSGTKTSTGSKTTQSKKSTKSKDGHRLSGKGSNLRLPKR